MSFETILASIVKTSAGHQASCGVRTGVKAGLSRWEGGYLNRRVRDLDDEEPEEPDEDLVDDIRDAEGRGLDIDHELW